MSDDVAALRSGDLLAGRYRVERVLGRGSVGFVVAATDLERGEPRAIKLLSHASLAHETTVERFFREARALGRLTSEHTVRVFAAGLLEDGTPYLVMEQLDGVDLASATKRRGAIPAHEAALYVLQACEALVEAHASGIVHRDLKPGNLFLARGGDGGPPCLKVLDFGLSKQAVEDADEPRLTLTNEVLGSPAYMAPEQVVSSRSADARSDVWSLGVVLYQLVTGKLPFRSDDGGEVLTLVMKSTPAAPSTLRAGLPLALDAVVLRCLEKDPARRYPSAAALSAALAPFVPGRAPAPPSPPEAAPPAPRRRLPLALAVAAVVLALAAAAALALLHG
jgi:eukaryotic-like serine/threonine-protein kinase